MSLAKNSAGLVAAEETRWAAVTASTGAMHEGTVDCEDVNMSDAFSPAAESPPSGSRRNVRGNSEDLYGSETTLTVSPFSTAGLYVGQIEEKASTTDSPVGAFGPSLSSQNNPLLNLQSSQSPGEAKDKAETKSAKIAKYKARFSGTRGTPSNSSTSPMGWSKPGLSSVQSAPTRPVSPIGETVSPQDGSPTAKRRKVGDLPRERSSLERE